MHAQLNKWIIWNQHLTTNESRSEMGREINELTLRQWTFRKRGISALDGEECL